MINEHPKAVDVRVNGIHYRLAPGQRLGPVAVEPSSNGNDVIDVALADLATCGLGSAEGYFQGGAGNSFTLTVTTGGTCPLDDGSSVASPYFRGVQPS